MPVKKTAQKSTIAYSRGAHSGGAHSGEHSVGNKLRKKSSASITFKIFTSILLIAACCIIYDNYFGAKFIAFQEEEEPTSTPKVMEVRIENVRDTYESDDEEKARKDKQKDSEYLSIDAEKPQDKHSAVKMEYEIKLAQYRMHLSAVAHLCSKFLKHENYERELSFLSQDIELYPEEIVSIISELREYENDSHVHNSEEPYRKLTLPNGFMGSILGKIMDLEKRNPEYITREAKYNKISSQLDKLMLYFYSSEFQKALMLKETQGEK